MATIARLIVDVSASTLSLDKELQRAGRRLESFGSKLSSVGRTLTAGLTLPLVGAAAGAVAAANAIDEALDTIRAGTGATGDQLALLRTSFENVFKAVPASAENVATAIADLNTRLGIMGAPLEALATQVLEVSRLTKSDLGATVAGVTRVFGDWSIAVEKQAGTLDFLFKASQATGSELTTLAERVVQFGAPLRQMGFSFEQAAALLGKFEQEGVNTELVVGSMRIALGNLAKAGIEPAEGFRQLVTQIQQAGTVAEANQLAIKTFGARAGPDMAAAIREGRFSIDELVASLQGSRETILKAGQDTLSFAERMTTLKNNVILAIAPIGEQLIAALESVLPTVIKLVTFVGKLASFFASLPEPVQVVVGGVLALTAAMGPLLFIAGSLVTALGALTPLLPALGVALVSTVGPVGLVIAAIAALGFAGTVFIRDWDVVRLRWVELWTEIQDIAFKGIGGILDLLSKLSRLPGPISAIGVGANALRGEVEALHDRALARMVPLLEEAETRIASSGEAAAMAAPQVAAVAREMTTLAGSQATVATEFQKSQQVQEDLFALFGGDAVTNAAGRMNDLRVESERLLKTGLSPQAPAIRANVLEYERLADQVQRATAAQADLQRIQAATVREDLFTLFGGDALTHVAERMNFLRGEAERLRTEGFAPQGAEIQALVLEYVQLADKLDRAAAAQAQSAALQQGAAQTIADVQSPVQLYAANVNFLTAQLTAGLISAEQFRLKLVELRDEFATSQQAGLALGETLQASLGSALEGAAVAIGRAVAGVAQGMKGLGKAVLSILGSIAQQVGKAMIAFGIAGLKIRAFVANPAAAIAAGAALVALGAALASTATSIAETQGAGGGAAATAPASFAPSGAGGAGGTIIVQMPAGQVFNPNDPRQVDEFARMLQDISGRRVIVETVS